MKRIFLKIIGIVSIATICCLSCGNAVRIKGNGELATSEKTVSAFEQIACAAGSVEVRFYASDKYRAVVTVDSNLDNYVDVFVKENVLYIGTKTGHYYKFTKFSVDVYSPFLTGVSVSGSGQFKGVDKIVTSTFTANVSGSGGLSGRIECDSFSGTITGSGKIDGTVECDNFSGTISGSGNLIVAGTCREANVSITGSGSFNGNYFNTKNASVIVSGSGKANISVADNLNAKITGSGKITYRGNPKIDSVISGSGKVVSN